MAVLNDKLQVSRVLRDISLLLSLRGENAFKSRAYNIGADRIAGLSEDLATLVAEDRLDQLPGIGKALAEKVSELVRTGSLGYFEALRAQFPPGILSLLALPDLGPRKVAALFRELQVGDIASLELACREGKVRGLKGFGERTELNILEGIARYRKAHDRRLLGAVLPRAEELLQHVQAAPGVIRANLAGSVRRSCETVADVDIVASAELAAPVLEALASHPSVAKVLGRGENKCSVLLREDDLQVDLRVLPDADFATALHHLTGSKPHHIRLRGLAQDRGLKISEYGVFRGEEKLPVPDEAALYQLLGMRAIPPELREDAGEVEAALDGSLPERLLLSSDVRGAVHSHSTWSDGRNTLEEMALAAQALGLEYLTVTEHSQTAVYAGGMKPEDLQRQWDEIDALNARLSGFRLLKGIESDILADGNLDLPEDLLARLDLVIASVHIRHGMDETQMTDRVLRALDHPFTHILGHPTGRLIQSREAFPLHMATVLDRAAARGVAVEVNGNPERLDLKAEHVRMALQRGVRLVVSVDAHNTSGLKNLAYAVATARKGWARPEDVLNTFSARDFLHQLRRPGSPSLSPPQTL